MFSSRETQEVAQCAFNVLEEMYRKKYKGKWSDWLSIHEYINTCIN